MDLSCSKFEGEVLDMCSSTPIVPQLLRSLLVAGADAPHSSPVEAVSVSASAITVFGHGVGVLLWNSSCRAFLHSIEVSWGKSEVYMIWFPHPGLGVSLSVFDWCCGVHDDDDS